MVAAILDGGIGQLLRQLVVVLLLLPIRSAIEGVHHSVSMSVHAHELSFSMQQLLLLLLVMMGHGTRQSRTRRLVHGVVRPHLGQAVVHLDVGVAGHAVLLGMLLTRVVDGKVEIDVGEVEEGSEVVVGEGRHRGAILLRLRP